MEGRFADKFLQDLEDLSADEEEKFEDEKMSDGDDDEDFAEYEERE